MNRQELLILGNGFDLACGLRSTYHDFFKYRFEQILQEYEIPLNTDVFNTIKNHCDSFKTIVFDAVNPQFGPLNFWDAVFIFKLSENTISDNGNWCNIERVIKEVVTSILNNEDIDETIKPLAKGLREKYLNSSCTTQSIATFLLSELNKFEESFAYYIRKEKEQNFLYQQKARQNIETLMPLSLGNPSVKGPVEITVLSFNYSLDIIDGFMEGVNRIKEWINIHGYVGNERKLCYRCPIFGIDSKQIDENDNRIIFTKTSRVANEITNFVKPLPQKVDHLVFYGHSLSEADYSYFESLFDMYDLYSSKISLYFYFAEYDVPKGINKLDEHRKNIVLEQIAENNDMLRREMTTKVYKLFNHYGRSLKQNHGDNLFHRLLLESRVHVIERHGDREFNIMN